MRDVARIPEVINELERAWLQNPDFRLTQLIMAIASTGEHAPKLFQMEDDVLLKAIQNFNIKQ